MPATPRKGGNGPLHGVTVVALEHAIAALRANGAI